MIDWLTVTIDLLHVPISNGRIISLDSDSAIEWETPKKRTVRGSYDSSVLVRSVGVVQGKKVTQLQIDGNPTKYLQGHNIYGVDDLSFLMEKWVLAICQELGITPSDREMLKVRVGDYKLTRVDVNYMYALDSEINVDQFLIALGQTSGTKYRTAYYTRGSVYFNKGSSRWSSCVYNKFKETKSRKKGHRIELPSETTEILRKYAKDKFRWEFRFLSLELKDLGIKSGLDLMNYGIKNLFDTYMKRINVYGNVKLNDSLTSQLPTKLRATYELWLAGHDLRSILPRATFFRHKKQLKEDWQVNIDDQPREQGSNVVSLSRVLEPRPVEIPQELYDKNLIIYPEDNRGNTAFKLQPELNIKQAVQRNDNVIEMFVDNRKRALNCVQYE